LRRLSGTWVVYQSTSEVNNLLMADVGFGWV
jgi:hypothetical protein